MSAAKTPDLTVYYDGACPLCTAEIGLYRTCQGADRVAFIDAAAGGVTGADLDQQTALARFHVRDVHGTLHSGAAGFAQLWLALPSWAWLGRVTMQPGIRSIAEVAYRGFLLVRPLMQRAWRRGKKAAAP